MQMRKISIIYDGISYHVANAGCLLAGTFANRGPGADAHTVTNAGYNLIADGAVDFHSGGLLTLQLLQRESWK